MVLDALFSPIFALTPVIAIFIIGASISIFMSLVNKKVLGGKRAKEVKKDMQDARAKMLDAQKSGDMNKMNEHFKELMKLNSEYMRFMFKPMIVSIILFILIVPVIRGRYEHTGQAVATIPDTFPIIGGSGLSWFWWYVICTFAVSIIAKKILGI